MVCDPCSFSWIKHHEKSDHVHHLAVNVLFSFGMIFAEIVYPAIYNDKKIYICHYWNAIWQDYSEALFAQNYYDISFLTNQMYL